VIGRQLVPDPHGQPLPYVRHVALIGWQFGDFLVVDEQPVGVLDLQIVGVSQFDQQARDAAAVAD
jgi:hypothetical protein